MTRILYTKNFTRPLKESERLSLRYSARDFLDDDQAVHPQIAHVGKMVYRLDWERPYLVKAHGEVVRLPKTPWARLYSPEDPWEAPGDTHGIVEHPSAILVNCNLRILKKSNSTEKALQNAKDGVLWYINRKDLVVSRRRLNRFRHSNSDPKYHIDFLMLMSSRSESYMRNASLKEIVGYSYDTLIIEKVDVVEFALSN